MRNGKLFLKICKPKNLDQIRLPQELIKILIDLSSIDDVISWCQTNTVIKSLCNESFWADRLFKQYPGYVGNLYHNSYKETIKILYYGKSIIRDDEFGDYKGKMIITGETTIYNIGDSHKHWELPYTIGGIEYTISHNKNNGTMAFPLDVMVEVDKGNILLYTILLPNGENLFLLAQTLYVWG